MRIALLGLMGAALLIACNASGREWRDSTGQHKIEAELVSLANGNVWLKKPTGEVICVPEDRLSLADRVFIRQQAASPPQPAQPPAPAQPGAALSLVDLTERVEPAVVRIDAGQSIGSGFVVDPLGVIATNHHVVEGSRSATVTFKDGKTARVIGYLGTDVSKDIVLLKVQTYGELPSLSLRVGLPRKGESVAAFGAPQGLDFSVSQGIVSAVRTDAELQRLVSNLTGHNERALDMVWVQTTAAISGGNSGGPLVDTHGQVVGVNTKTRTNGQNLNFAISCQDVSKLLSASFANPTQSLAMLPKSSRSSQPPSSSSAAVTGSRFPSITLPSGSTFSTTLVEIPKDWPECNFRRETAFRLTKFPNGDPKSLHAFLNARLHGPSVVLNDDETPRWAADYYEGDRHGNLRMWDEKVQLAFFAQYLRGGKKGFVCVFQGNMPWLVQEWDKDQLLGEYLVGWNAGAPIVSDAKSVSDAQLATDLAAARKRLAELEDKLLDEETTAKRDLAEWFRELDREIKQARVAASNVRKRRQTISALQARSAADQAAMGALLRKAWTGR